jgi:hypothetical protein
VFELARHVKVVTGEAVNGNVETESGTLAANVYAVVNGKSAYSITAVKRGQHVACIIVYDD